MAPPARVALCVLTLWHAAVAGFLPMRADAAGGVLGWAGSHFTSRHRTAAGRRAGPRVDGGVKPLLQVPYAQLRRRLREADGAADNSTAALLDPCQEQAMARTQPYVIGVLVWPGGHVSQWLDDTGGVRNPCTDADFSELLAQSGALVAVFRLVVEDLAILRLESTGDQRYAVLTADYKVETASVYSLYAMSEPRVVTSYTTEHASDAGYVLALPIVISGQLTISSLFGSPDFHTSMSVLDATTCDECLRAESVYQRLVRGNGYFGSRDVNLSAIPEEALTFKCINSVSCAWGVGWCTACLKRSLDRNVVQAYSVGDLLGTSDGELSSYPEGRLDFGDAVDDFENVCITVCSTMIEVGWLGTDQFGQQLGSAVMLSSVDALQLMALFPTVYGINGTVLAQYANDLAEAGATVEVRFQT